MKKTNTLFIGMVIGIALIVLSGCNSKFGQAIGGKLFTPTEYITNDIPEQVVQRTVNQEVVTTVTNAAGSVFTTTNQQPVVVNVTVPAHSVPVPVAYKPNEQSVQFVQGIGTVIGTLFPGWGALATSGILALWGAAAQAKGKKYREALVATASGVEQFAAGYEQAGMKPVGTQLKQLLAAVHKDADVVPIVTDVLKQDVPIVPTFKPTGFVPSPAL